MTDKLEQLFAPARSEVRGGGDASSALMGRVLADAYALQPDAVVSPKPARPAWLRLWSGAVASFGGRGATAGLGLAAVAGVVIGYASPPAADWLAQGFTSYGASGVELLSADDLFLTEG